MPESLRTAQGISDRVAAIKRWLVVFLSFLVRNFLKDRILLSAGSLAFQTLLSLVPLSTVILSVLKVFPVFASMQLFIEDFIFQNFVPEQAALLKGYLLEFIGKTSTVPVIGGLFLFVIALFLISTIDNTLNGIWEVNAPRKLLEGFTLYWTVLTLGPLFIGTSLVASSFVWFTVFTHQALLEMKTLLLSFIPFINSVVAFFLLYMLVPNCRVRFYHAVTGGLLAAVLFELAKKWFTFYVSSFATFEHIYGALSVIPMLFFWIYLEWVVVLTGAEFVYCLGVFGGSHKEEQPFDPLGGMADILSVLGHIWEGQASGRFMNMNKLWSAENIANHGKLSHIVDVLVKSNIVHRTAGGDLAVSSNLYTLTLFDLYSKMPPELVRGDTRVSVRKRSGEELDALRGRVLESLRNEMNVSVMTLLHDT